MFIVKVETETTERSISVSDFTQSNKNEKEIFFTFSANTFFKQHLLLSSK